MSRQTSLGDGSVRQLCQAFRISRAAFYAARSKPPRSALERRERSGDWASAAQIEPELRRLIADHPAWGVRKAWACLRRQGLIVSRRRLHALMQAWGLVQLPISQRDPALPRGHVSVPESNRRWGSDLTTVWTRRDGLVAVVPVVDCGDRQCLALGVSKAQASVVVLAPVAHALESEFGDLASVPDGLELRTDHGPQYTGADCEQLCADWNLEHTFAPIGRPTGNAVSERFILTMKLELIWTRDWESIDELREALERWIEVYNHQRPHQALDWQTPAERRARNLNTRSEAA